MTPEMLVSAGVLVVAVLFALFYKPQKPTPPTSIPVGPPQTAPPPVAPSPQSPPIPASPVQAFVQMGDGHMNAEFARAMGIYQAQKWAKEMSGALEIITRPAPGADAPKS